MATQLDNFKKQLNKLKAQGVDIDTEQLIKEIQNPVIKEEPKFNEEAFALAKIKINKLLDDYQNFYGLKGCTLKVEVYIGKENSADTFTENFPYVPNKLEVIHTVEIGTKGKYEPVDCVGESVKNEM